MTGEFYRVGSLVFWFDGLRFLAFGVHDWRRSYMAIEVRASVNRQKGK